MAVPSFDFCIVGSGFAGSLLAERLVEAKAKVLMLESGIDALDSSTLSDRQFSYSYHSDTLPGMQSFLTTGGWWSQ